MSEQHLAKGSTLPPYSGKLRIYSMRFCPYAQRAILALKAKKLDYEVVNINLKDKPEWLTSKSPLGKVPALEVEENVCVYESLVVAEYIDDKYPEPRLTSEDPLRKAMDKLIIENFNKVITGYYGTLYSKGDLEDSVAEDIFKGLEELQNQLKKRGTKFLAGDSAPGMVDYMVWPWFERIELMPKFANEKFTIDKSRFKALLDWTEAMKEDPAVKGHYLPPETHYQFLDEYIKGTANYEVGNKQQDAPVCGWRPKKKQ